MKRRLGTIVLFVLLVLTVIALQRMNTPSGTVSAASGEVQTTTAN